MDLLLNTLLRVHTALTIVIAINRIDNALIWITTTLAVTESLKSDISNKIRHHSTTVVIICQHWILTATTK